MLKLFWLNMRISNQKTFYMYFSINMILLNKIDKDQMLVHNIDPVYFILMMMILILLIKCQSQFKRCTQEKPFILKFRRQKPFGKLKKCTKDTWRKQVSQQKRGVMILLCVIIDKINNNYMKLAFLLILISQSFAINYSIRGQSNLLDLT